MLNKGPKVSMVVKLCLHHRVRGQLRMNIQLLMCSHLWRIFWQSHPQRHLSSADPDGANQGTYRIADAQILGVFKLTPALYFVKLQEVLCKAARRYLLTSDKEKVPKAKPPPPVSEAP
ncbi:Uncharacterized protein Fot_22140 [Forsythia ovata]|uniref:Uncharacterized protein n=1 Tax=Forsythia ovata TaxID=205694 RepID=A0ABD1UWW4_9LAMI